MLSPVSKSLITVLLFICTVYIAVTHSPFNEYLDTQQNTANEELHVEHLVKKEKDTERASVSTSSLPKSAVSSSESNGVQRNDSPVPKVTDNKVGVYEVLETTHSDTDDSYQPVVSPCTRPMSYNIGTFDSRFNMSKETFIEIIKSAAGVWEEKSGVPLFVYNPHGTLTINLIYDERQATTVDLGYLALEIENSKQSAESIRKGYEGEKVSYESDSEAFNADAKMFEERYKTYNDKVKAYNDKGGATQLEYDIMMKELGQLKTDSSQLEERRGELLKRMESINANVKRYNELVAYINTMIKKSNSLGKRTFTEGKFTPAINTIDIYQYADTTKLKRVLIHELGHVMGIGHVKNAASVMYSFNSGTSTSLSREDMEAFLSVCSHN